MTTENVAFVHLYLLETSWIWYWGDRVFGLPKSMTNQSKKRFCKIIEFKFVKTGKVIIAEDTSSQRECNQLSC